MLNRITLIAILVLGFTCNAVAQTVSTSVGQPEGVVYKVQVMAVANPVAEDAHLFRKLNNIVSYEHNGFVTYTWGKTALLNEAARLQGEARRQGFTDAFVVPYYNNKRITMEEASAINKQHKRL